MYTEGIAHHQLSQVASPCINFRRIQNVSMLNFPQNQECTQDVRQMEEIGPLRPIECLISIGHFPPKSPIISGSLAE